MNTSMENGVQMTLDQWMPQIFQKQTAGASAPLAKISLSQEGEPVSKETEAVLSEKYLESLPKSGKRINLNGSSMKMLRECLAAIKDLTSFPYSLNLTRGGYDIEWQLLNSKLHGVPQNRERVYTIGHLRSRGTRKIFPIGPTDGKDCIQHQQNGLYVKQVGKDGTSNRDNPNQYRVYETDGLSPCLNSMNGGGREPHIPVSVNRNGIGGGRNTAQTLMARDYKGIGNQDMTAVLELINLKTDSQENKPTLSQQEKTEESVNKNRQEPQ